MVDIHVNDNTNQIRINVNPTSNSVSSTIGNEAFYNGLAKEWAISENLVQGIDYSSKYYAQQAREIEEDIAADTNNAHIWAEGTDEEVQALGGEHSSKGWVNYVLTNPPTAYTEQIEGGATLTVTDINGTTTTTILNGQNGVDGQDGQDGVDGQDGQDGFSPTATVTQSGDITTISITDKNGTTTESIDLSDYQDLLVSGTNIKTINNETVLGSGNINIQSSTVAYGTSSTAGNVAEKEVSIPEITELNVGQILYIKPSASATVANLTIKLNNFTAYPIRYNNSAITTTSDDLVWSQNFVSQFIFDGTYWQFAGRGYDNNSTYTLNILFDRGNFVSGSGTYAITRYSLCLQKPDMTWEKVTNTEEDYSLATNKTVNTHGFLLNGAMLYYSSSTVLKNGAVAAANTMYRQNSGFDMRYSANSIGTGYTAGDYIYFVGTIGVDGLFYLDSTQWLTNTLPSTNDGKIYVKVGKYISGVTITLELEHPAYYHNGTRICVYQSASNKQDTLVSGTNIKTINNQSLLGSGNITIQGGGGGGAVDSVNGYTGTVVLTASDVGALATSDVTEYTAQEVETLWGSI